MGSRPRLLGAVDARLAGLAPPDDSRDDDIPAEVEPAAALEARDLAEAELRGAEERRESARAALLQAEQKLKGTTRGSGDRGGARAPRARSPNRAGGSVGRIWSSAANG